VFVTGTDTGVGKTVVSAALLHRYGAAGYWKPVQTGIEEDDDTETVRRLAGAGDARLLREGVRLPRPVSPHLAARLSGTTIEVPHLVAIAARQPPAGRWVVEGAGGVLVPLSDTRLMIDLVCELALPVVVAARTTLGTINHSLLTLEALRARRLRVAGVVLVGEPHADNRDTIERRGAVPVLGELPWLTPLTATTLGTWAASSLDRDARLGSLLG
jgi:dethiobiotin synthase